jgi:hypothetical protein
VAIITRSLLFLFAVFLRLKTMLDLTWTKLLVPTNK